MGALVPPQHHAVAYASADAESVVAGFVLEGLGADERVVVLTGDSTPRAVAARLRAQGVAPPPRKPSALRIVDASPGLTPLGPLLSGLAAEAKRDGYDGVRVLHAPKRERAADALRHEALLPLRFPFPATLLCLYTASNLEGVPQDAAWGAARHHARLLCL